MGITYAWGILRGKKVSPLDIYADKDIVLADGEKLVRVTIMYETDTKRVKRKTRT